METKTRIRINYGSMPFDRNGVHATGREVYRLTASGSRMDWFPEYEDDSTTDLPETDPGYDPETDEYVSQ